LVSPDGSLLCECGYDFRSESGGGRIASASILRAALIAAIPMEFVAWTGFVHLQALGRSGGTTPWIVFGLLIHFPVDIGPLLDWHEPTQAMVMIVVGYINSAILAFLAVAAVRATSWLIKKMRNV
jgi:hypothetical protein